MIIVDNFKTNGMKKLIIIALLALTIGNLFGQVQKVKKGEYIEVPENSKFEGKWQYISGKDTFTIKLKSKKVFTNIGGGIYVDNIVGEYYINSKKFGDLESKDVIKQAINYGIVNRNTPNILNANFNDQNYKAGATLKIFLMNNNQIKWNIIPRERVGINIKLKPHVFSVPTEMILYKVN